MEFTAIEVVAMSPCTPPAIFIDRLGIPSISVESYRLGCAEVGLHVQPDDWFARDVAHAVLNDAAHQARLHRQELARHARLGDLRLDLVGYAIELPPHGGRNHRNRLGEADVAHLPLLHSQRELFAREA